MADTFYSAANAGSEARPNEDVTSKVEMLDPSYRIRNKDYKKFFKVGRVFMTLWTEPAGLDVKKELTKPTERTENGFIRGHLAPGVRRLAAQLRARARETENFIRPVLTYPSAMSADFARKHDFRRKVVPVILNGKKVLARPDTGSESDAMSADFAKEHGFPICRSESDKAAFKLGDGRIMTSSGTTYIPCVLPGAGHKSEGRLFHVFEKCAFPLLLGLEFISKTNLLQKFRHLLQDAPSLFVGMPMLKRIGKPQGRIYFTADGRSLSACPDTGSDLNFMSIHCAKRNGFTIDRSPKYQTQVMIADTSIVQTIGLVNISSLSVKGHCDIHTAFHVLPGLSYDAIFSEEFLHDIDAFNTCVEISDGVGLDPFSLNTLINLGRVQGFLSKSFGRKSTKQTLMGSDEAEHDRDMENEDYRRNNFKRALSSMTSAEQADANRIEDARLRSFNSRHDRCQYCVNRRTSSGPGRPP